MLRINDEAMTINASLEITAWRREDLEALSCCPVCGGTGADKMYEGLYDFVFSAPGYWTLWRCKDCQAAYLNPRPTATSIGLAYKNYFTHESAEFVGNTSRKLLQLFKHSLRNSYINHKLGHTLRPSVPGGWATVAPVRTLTRRALHHVRHLSRPVVGKNRLLDVGCGNGNFLNVARTLGYEAYGLEMDPRAVEVARGHGLDVTRGMFPGSCLPYNSFDYITLRHVIEHLYDPVGALVEAFSLLREGGRVWVHTPNINSNGHRQFGAAWRGLEPPRHLVLFNYQSLLRVMCAAGFKQVELLPPGTESQFCFQQSAAIQDGRNPNGGDFQPARFFGREIRRAERHASKYPETAESITMLGQK